MHEPGTPSGTDHQPEIREIIRAEEWKLKLWTKKVVQRETRNEHLRNSSNLSMIIPRLNCDLKIYFMCLIQKKLQMPIEMKIWNWKTNIILDILVNHLDSFYHFKLLQLTDPEEML